jgi:hypothetical protein
MKLVKSSITYTKCKCFIWEGKGCFFLIEQRLSIYIVTECVFIFLSFVKKKSCGISPEIKMAIDP